MHGTVCRLKSSWRPSVVGTQTSSLWMGAQFLEDDPRHQSGRGAPELLTQRDGQTVGEEGDEQVRLDAVRSLMKNGAQTEVPFACAERFLDKTELHVTAPDQFGIVGRQVGAQQIPALAPADRAQLATIQLIRQRPIARDFRPSPG